MSSIHYKFRATLEYKTLQFDGLHITGADLKREICSKEGIKAEAFDLLLQNAHTKRSYTAEELIPRNSSIIVQRVPREDAEKLPKIQGVNTGVVVRSSTTDSGLNAPAHMNPEEFEKLSEEDQIAHIKDVSTAKYHSSNFQKKTTNIMSGPPPPTYTCNRCYQPGHWYKNCPMLATKRTTGIPSQELMETTAEDPLAMLHPSGKLVVPIMHWKARQHTKKVADEGPAVERVPPPELTCPLCSHLLKDAVLTTCCGHSFCADCISNKLMESPDRQCPGKNCDQKQLSVDALVPNKTVRQAAQTWAMGGPGSGSQDPEHMRFRIGLQPTIPAASTPPQTLPPAIPQVPTTAVIASQPSESVVAQNSPNPVVSVPPVSLPVPVSFSQPPPNMVAGVVASSSSSGDSLLPPGTTSIPPPTIAMPIPHVMHTSANLPPIPGVGLPLQTHMIAPTGAAQPPFIYNQPPPVSSMSIGAPQPQIMDAWDAFLHRKDRERERPRKPMRSRNRSSSSTSSSSSDDERRKRRDRHERERRRTHRSEKQRDRDRGRDTRFRRVDERKDRDRERERERDREQRDWNDRHRENRPSRSGGYQSRLREGKEEHNLPSLMGLDVATPPNFIASERRERSRSHSPQSSQMPAPSDRKRRKKKDRSKTDSSSRSHKSERDSRSGKTNENEDAAREIADEEAIDGTLREVAEFVRVEANCGDDAIEFDVEEIEVVKEAEPEDEKSVTDTEPQHDDSVETAAENMSEAENEEPLIRKSESDATEVAKEETTTDKEKECEEKESEDQVVDDEQKSSPRKKEKKHKKHKKHRKHRDEDGEGDAESKHRHKRKKEKKEKKEKKKRDKKHRRDKDEDSSDHRTKEDELKKREGQSESAEEKGNRVKTDHKEDRHGSESSRKSKEHEHIKSTSMDGHDDRERKTKNESSKSYDDKRKDRGHSIAADEKRHRHEKSRNRSRERDDKKYKDRSDRGKTDEKTHERESSDRHRESKEGSKSKGRREVERKSETSAEKNQRRENAHGDDRKQKPTPNPSDVKVQQTAGKESLLSEAREVSQLKEIESERPATSRKQKVTAPVHDDDQPVVKKPKTDTGPSAGPIKSALASIVRFKVGSSPVKKIAPVLKPFTGAEKDSTDVEEERSKVPTEDDGGSGDRRMREAFSPPKLQRKKITLNL
ncbi:hypothetical protein Q1695_009023 [Nippostrongylus brasiliensis]|nr:hypothetical protein Q1695_009023 [Nippostrongylus brasiliensis]